MSGRSTAPRSSTSIVEAAPTNGWTQLSEHLHHRLIGELTVAYLEDHDGFEVELIAPTDPTV